MSSQVGEKLKIASWKKLRQKVILKRPCKVFATLINV